MGKVEVLNAHTFFPQKAIPMWFSYLPLKPCPSSYHSVQQTQCRSKSVPLSVKHRKSGAQAVQMNVGLLYDNALYKNLNYQQSKQIGGRSESKNFKVGWT